MTLEMGSAETWSALVSDAAARCFSVSTSRLIGGFYILKLLQAHSEPGITFNLFVTV